MSSILEDLFDGKVCPNENLIPKNSEFPALAKKINDIENYFRSVLPDADKEAFNTLETMGDDLSVMESVEAFSRGFRLAAMLIVDLYYNKGDLQDVRKLFGLGESE